MTRWLGLWWVVGATALTACGSASKTEKSDITGEAKPDGATRDPAEGPDASSLDGGETPVDGGMDAAMLMDDVPSALDAGAEDGSMAEDSSTPDEAPDAAATDQACDGAEDGDPCDDGDVCTDDDACLAGACVGGSSLTCDDGNPCTDDSCDGDSGCVYENNLADCDDGDACTTDDACADGTCGGTLIACDDSDACTSDSCDPATGCVHTPDAIDCSGEDDACSVGVCQAGSGTCERRPAHDGNACDDADACTEQDACAAGVCTGQAVACDDGDPCTDDSCDPANGCVHVDNTVACDDGDACTEADRCGGGACQAGARVSCDDGNACTDDGCDVGRGCTHTNNTSACDDGNACTQSDRCGGGSCQAGAPIGCDDGNVCTDDGCDPTSGCTHSNNTLGCDDGNACTVGDRCGGGGCRGGSSLNCDDGNPCTDDSCDPALGCAHTNNGASCEDGNACTVNDRCGGGSCAAGNPIGCDDGNLCTADSCDPTLGCVHDGSGITVVCAADNLCDTRFRCQGDVAGTCASTSKKDCSALGDACHVGVCDPATGNCIAVAVVDGTGCDDGNACTQGDRCVAGSCQGAVAVSCEDGNPCTDDSCNPVSGCAHSNNANSCNDGDACTIADRCAGGVCLGGAARACDDGNRCTDDSCDPASGCVYGNNAASCDDGNACTTGDRCGGGSCAGNAVACDDLNPCTVDGCDPIGGCTHDGTGVTRACAPDSGCSVGFVCQGDAAGTCAATGVLDCSQLDDACNVGMCDPSGGVCVRVPVLDGTGCDDGDACSVADRCSAGTCVGGAPPDCDDGNACTDDACDSALGCQHLNNASACDDGSACTSGDQCSGGSCVGSGNPCGPYGSCVDSAAGYACNCAAGFTEVAGACVCDLDGTFAIRVATRLSWSGLSYIEDSNDASHTAPVVGYSWALRTHSYASDGTLTAVTIGCGGVTPDVCGTGLPFNLAPPEAYAQYQPTTIWGLPSMPTSTEVTTMLTPLPGLAFQTSMAASLLGIELADPFGAWPGTRADVGSGGPGSVNGAMWVDHDGDGASAVTSFVVPPGGVTEAQPPAPKTYGPTSDACRRLSSSTLNYAYLPGLEGLNVRRYKRIHLASRTISAYDGAFDANSCDTIRGSLVGPSPGTFFQADSRVSGCVRQDGSGETTCSATLIDFLDTQPQDQQRVDDASFIMKRIPDGSTCADVWGVGF